jgi:hypothetical protein
LTTRKNAAVCLNNLRCFDHHEYCQPSPS